MVGSLPRRRGLLLALAALLVVLVAAPAQARVGAKKAIWGPVQRNGVSQFPIYQDLGAKIYEASLPWASIATTRPANPTDPADPAYQWPAEIDKAVTDAKAAGMRVSLSISTAPTWANGGRSSDYAPLDAEDFAAFTQAASKHYPSVHLWQIWPEASRQEIFKPLTPEKRDRPLTSKMKQAPHHYAEILDASYAALHAADPANLVIGGGTFTTGDISAENWIKNLKLPSGLPPRTDLYGHNPFTTRSPDLNDHPLGHGFADFSDLDELAGWIDKYLAKGGRNRKLKLFLSEFSAPTDHANYEFNFHVTRAVQAAWTTAAMKIARKWSRIYALGWFSLYDDDPRPDGKEVNRGLLTYKGTRKPSYFAYKNG